MLDSFTLNPLFRIGLFVIHAILEVKEDVIQMHNSIARANKFRIMQFEAHLEIVRKR